MKKLYISFIFVAAYLAGTAQGFPMYTDSTTASMSQQLSFVGQREIIARNKISRCYIYSFHNENSNDSTLQKIVWFDTCGNLVKSIEGRSANPDSSLVSTFSFDAYNRPLTSHTGFGNRVLRKSSYSYHNDTISITSLNYWYDGDTLYFMNGKSEVKKTGCDTNFIQRIYNKKKQIIKLVNLFNNRKNKLTLVYLYDAKALPLKSYMIRKNKRKEDRFTYTHEFADGQYVMMKWDDGKQPLLKNNIACFYRNNQ